MVRSGGVKYSVPRIVRYGNYVMLSPELRQESWSEAEELSIVSPEVPEEGAAMEILFDSKAINDGDVFGKVTSFLNEVDTLEVVRKSPIIIYQDGKSKGYYVKCGILAEVASPLLDMNAKLDPVDSESFRANRDLLITHNTYRRMVSNAKEGREFNDIIVEYTKEYSSEKPLKIWGGQHRAKAIQKAYEEAGISRYHGFKISSSFRNSNVQK